MNTNWKLLQAIRGHGLTQRDFAVLVGEHEGTISKIVNGTQNPDPARKLRYAKALGMKITDLFPCPECTNGCKCNKTNIHQEATE